ncbi:MAG: NfeD family protein [Bacteroidales bacterium]|jgi:membrane-bound ClpP family serine protease
MSILAIIIIIVLGILLFIVEFLLIPGVTIAGIGGAILMGVAVYMSYKTHGNTVGNYTLIATLILTIGMFVYALRAKTWNRLMLKKDLEGKVEVGLENETVKVGDRGESITRMAPIGKVLINGLVVEGKSQRGFLDQHTPVEVIKVLNTQVIIKPIKKE